MGLVVWSNLEISINLGDTDSIYSAWLQHKAPAEPPAPLQVQSGHGMRTSKPNPHPQAQTQHRSTVLWWTLQMAWQCLQADVRLSLRILRLSCHMSLLPESGALSLSQTQSVHGRPFQPFKPSKLIREVLKIPCVASALILHICTHCMAGFPCSSQVLPIWRPRATPAHFLGALVCTADGWALQASRYPLQLKEGVLELLCVASAQAWSS